MRLAGLLTHIQLSLGLLLLPRPRPPFPSTFFHPSFCHQRIFCSVDWPATQVCRLIVSRNLVLGPCQKNKKSPFASEKIYHTLVRFRQKCHILSAAWYTGTTAKWEPFSQAELGDLPAHRASVAVASFPGPKRRKRKGSVSSLGLEMRLAS